MLFARGNGLGYVMRSKLAVALSFAVLSVLVLALPGYAQRGFRGGRGWGMRSHPNFPFHRIPSRGFRPGIRGRGFYGGFGAGTTIIPYWFPPYYYSDYYYQQVPREAPPVQTVIVERSAPAPEPPPPPPPNALVLERQGNRWVRITDSGANEVNGQAEQQKSVKASSTPRTEPSRTIAAAPPRVLPPAVLVFRDGHKEEITRYTIIGDTIYTSADYWNKGKWTKKVPLADLNVPATLELNKQRGANFNLPSGPGVVVVRP